MAIINVTPDSFSDGGQYFKPEEAIRRTHNLLSEGADIIDLGGESTRPDSTPISWEEEWSRLSPVLQGLQNLKAPISVDTYHIETAKRALDLGAKIINCVKVEPIAKLPEILRPYNAELVAPATTYPTLITDKVPFYLDPLIGFGTTREEDLTLLKSLPALAQKGRVLVGASRKRIVKKLTGEKMTGKNLGGNLGIAIWCALNGASIVRVHDVKETYQALKVIDGITNFTPNTDAQ